MMRVLLLPLFFLAACAFAQTSPLNDTGQTQCLEGGALAECTAANTGDGASHTRQDGRFGRDAQAGAGTLTKTGSGQAGFDFTRICNSGEAAGSDDCTADPALGAGTNDWACTRDNVTGLIWEVKTPANAGDTFNFDNASAVHAAAVNTAQLCGSADWRVPTRRELLSIVHHGATSSPRIDTTFFPNTQNGFYWSSDIWASAPAGAWVIDFGDGRSSGLSQTNVYHVRLVSGTMPPEPAPRFVDNLDGTVTDPATGLMWDRCAWGQTGTECGGSASTYNWQAALGIAVTANEGAGHRGFNDWRLPNRTELESLVDIDKATLPAVDTGAFPNTPSRFFWSSTVFTSSPDGAWGVSFDFGGSFPRLQSDFDRVRLVRSGQSFDALAAGVATEIVMITEPSSVAQSGVIFPQQPVVEVRDANGNPVQSAGTNITAAIASGGGTLTGTTTVATDANGRATFTNLAISGFVGDRTLSFSAGSLTPATSGTITLSAGPARQMAINGGDGQSAVAGQAVAALPSVIVRDASDNPVEGVEVAFAVAIGGGSVTGASATTNASGIATVGSWTLGTAVGENTLTATADGLTGSPLVFTATAQNAPPTAPVITAPTPGATVLIEGLLSDVFVPMWTPSTDINDDPLTYRWELGSDAQLSTILLSVPTGSDTQVTLTFEAIEQLLLANGVGVGDAVTLFHRAIASDGTDSVQGAAAEVTLTLGAVVGPPSGALQLQVEPVPLGLIVSWVAPSDNGGTPILSYRAEANPSCEVTALADEVPGQTAYSCTLGNLDPGREYTVTVTAINAVGETTVVAAAAVQPLPAIPIPTLGTWALLSLMLLMLVVAMPVLLRPRFTD